MYCQTLVSPGMGADLQTFFSLRALITLDFPTLGQPTNPMLIDFLSFLWKLTNCLNRFMSAPLPKGLVILALNAMVGYSVDKCFTHLEVTQTGTKSHLLRIKTICLWGQFFLIWSSRALDRVPQGSLASRIWTKTSEESITLYNSSQILLLCPAESLLSLVSYLISTSQSSMGLGMTIQSSFCPALSAKSSKLSMLVLTFFLLLWGPKVSAQVSTSRSFILFSLMGSLRREIGMFLCLIKMCFGFSFLWAISILNFSMAFWSMVFTLPNHFLLGSTLANSLGLTYIFFKSGFSLYILSLLMVALVLKELCLPLTLASVFRSGLVEELDLVFLAIFFWSVLFLVLLPSLLLLTIC